LPLAEVVYLEGNEDVQSSVEAMEDAKNSAKLDEEDDLSTDQIRASKKVNSIATIEVLCLNPSLLSRVPIPLCRLVAMPIVRPTLSSNLALPKDDFVHGYQEGDAVFYLSMINEAGLVDKVTDDNQESWGPL
jgi:hypothetical protein